MKRPPRWRLPGRLFGPDPRGDIESEISFHLEMRRRDYEAKGLDAGAAASAARERFGDVEAVRRACETEGERDRRSQRRRAVVSELRQDARYGLRVMLRAPLVYLVIVATLALGIGATTAMFSVVSAVLLRPLPYAAPDRLVRAWEVSPRGSDRNVVSPGNYLDWRARARSFETLGAHRAPYGIPLTGGGEPVHVRTADVTASLLEALGVGPAIGRGFTAEDARRADALVLLSDGFWRSRFGGERGVIGRTIALDAVPHTVVGVMPSSFRFPAAGTQVWRLLPDDAFDPGERRSHNFIVVGRLRAGITVAAARAEMSALAAAIAAEHPESMTDWGVNVVPLHADLVAEVRPMLLVLFGGVALVLLVACANIANLLLARALAREREMAVRGALGAGRARLARQVLTESLVLAGAGALLGLIVAHVGLDALLALAPADIPSIETVRIDGGVLAFVAFVTAVSTVLFGVLPALRLAAADLQATLRTADPRVGGGRSRARSALLVAEVAISLVLLAGAGLLVRSSAALARVDYGYRPDGLVAVLLDLPRARYDSTAAHQAFYARLIERVAAIPGVARVGGTSEPPASGFEMTFSFALEDRPSHNPSGREDPRNLHVVTPEYFAAMGIPLVAGRTFDARDRAGAPAVVVINESLARTHWAGESPLGKRISFIGAEGPWLEIVGVVGDTRMSGTDQPPVPALYVPHAQKTWTWMSWLTLIVRPAPGVEPVSLTGALQSAVREMDPELPIQRIAEVTDFYGESLARRRFATTLLVGFALVALALGVTGMYGVLSYAVAQRRRDIGIRVALGATRATVLREVVAHALRLALLGIGIGLAASLALGGALRGLLYETSPTDPLTLAAVALLLVLVALASAGVPAWRATRISPLAVIREA